MLTLIGVNIEAVYKYPLHRSLWVVVRGRRAGDQLLQLRQRRDSDTRGGLNFVGGLEHDRGLFFEVKVGAWESADLKFGVGYNFGRLTGHG